MSLFTRSLSFVIKMLKIINSNRIKKVHRPISQRMQISLSDTKAGIWTLDLQNQRITKVFCLRRTAKQTHEWLFLIWGQFVWYINLSDLSIDLFPLWTILELREPNFFKKVSTKFYLANGIKITKNLCLFGEKIFAKPFQK